MSEDERWLLGEVDTRAVTLSREQFLAWISSRESEAREADERGHHDIAGAIRSEIDATVAALPVGVALAFADDLRHMGY